MPEKQIFIVIVLSKSKKLILLVIEIAIYFNRGQVTPAHHRRAICANSLEFIRVVAVINNWSEVVDYFATGKLGCHLACHQIFKYST